MVLHLREATEAFALLLRAIPFVQEAKMIDNKLLVVVDGPGIRNPEIVRTLVAAGADIRFVGELRHSLEDVYFQLMKYA